MTSFQIRIAAILTPAAIFFVWLAFKFGPAEGLWMNLGTEFGGVLVTVLVVDRILERHEAKEWKGYRSRGHLRCRVLCNSVISSLRNAGGWPPAMITEGIPLEEGALHKRLIQFASTTVSPEMKGLMETLSLDKWNALHRNFHGANQEIETIIQRFGKHFTPSQMEALDEVSRKLSSATIIPTTFPEIFDASAGNPRKDIREMGINQTADSLRELITAISSLSVSLGAGD